MNRRNIWKRPPSYCGYHSNKRVLQTFAVMAQGLAVIVNNPTFAKRLIDLSSLLRYRSSDRGHADVQFFVGIVFEDLLSVREEAGNGDHTELEAALNQLQDDVSKLSDLIRNDVPITPWEESVDRSVARLFQNTEAIRIIYRRTVEDLRREKKKLETIGVKLLTADTTGSERARMELRERRIAAYCSLREQAVTVLEDILDELQVLMELARNAPALAGWANRRLHVKRLADFYVRPIQSQRQRERLEGQLAYIIRSAEKSSESVKAWNAALYGSENTVPESEAETQAAVVDSTETVNGHEGMRKDFVIQTKSDFESGLAENKYGKGEHNECRKQSSERVPSGGKTGTCSS